MTFDRWSRYDVTSLNLVTSLVVAAAAAATSSASATNRGLLVNANILNLIL